jgi:hypothetical protein
VATPSATDTEPIGVTSITIPSVHEFPATECPPLRIAVGKPARLAKPIVSDASSGVLHSTTAAGLTLSKRAIAGLRTWS